MGIFSRTKVVPEQAVQNQLDNGDIKRYNTTATSGSVYDPEFASNFNITDGDYSDYAQTGELPNYFGKWERAEISKIRNWHYSRYTYSNLPEGITKELIENQALLNGQLMIFKLKELFMIRPFTIATKDLNGLPATVTPVFSEGDIPKSIKKSYRVGKECVIFKTTNDSYWFDSSSGRLPFGVMYKCLPHITALANEIQEISENTNFSKEQIWLGMYGVDDTALDQLNAAMKSKARVIGVDPNIIKNIPNVDAKQNHFGLEYKNIIKELKETYHFLCDNLKELLGVNHTPVTDKKEKMNQMELGGNNEWLSCIAATEFEKRSESIEEMNKLFGTNVSIEKAEHYQQNKPTDTVVEKGEKTDGLSE